MQTVAAAEISIGTTAALASNAPAALPLQTLPITLVAGGTVGQTVRMQLIASGGATPYNWTVQSGSLPSGVSLSGTGLVSGTLAAPGTFNVTAQVADNTLPAQVKTQKLTLVVAPAPLAILPTAMPAGKVGSPFSAALQVSGGTPSFNWSVTSGSLPQGLTLSTAGVISGTPTASGTATFVATVNDSAKTTQSRSQAFSIGVTQAPVAVLPTFLKAAQKDTNYSASVRATGGNGNYVWSVISGALPSGLTLSDAGTISGTPTSSGTAFFTLGVRDTSAQAGNAFAGLSLTVTTPVLPLSITTGGLSAASTGSSYSSTLSATGGTPGYTWSVSSGTLPAGLSLSNTGVISGTPTASGSSNFTVAVVDNDAPAKQATKALSVTVSASPLSITTGSIPAAQNAVNYAAQLSATGGTPGYTWLLTSGKLPAGLSLQATTGSIVGTPSASGSSTFTYAVSDNANPKQTASATATISVTDTPAPGAFTTWFVRPDGGNRYDAALYNLGQCDGKADAPYPGTGYNQHCAFSDVRYMWMIGTYGNSGWVMQGGDTLVIRGCKALPKQENADGTHCRIGWDSDSGNTADNFWGSGVSAWWGLSMPPPPSGTPNQHTRILGECAYGSYSCNPVINYPYTGNNLTQLYASFSSGVALYLYGSKFVDLEGLELTTHNGKCARYGTRNPLPGCNRGSSYPLSDQADQGIATDNKTSDVLLQDMYIHGFSSNGIGGPIGGKITVNRANISFNNFAGWNFDDGKPTNNAPGSSVEQHYVTMVGNGCQEEYPIVHTQFPAKGCWDSTTGGFGDAWSGQDGNLDSFTCDHCLIAYNTKDGAMGPHTGIVNIALTNSAWIGNMGQDGKWGQNDNATFLFQNNVIVGNCLRMSQLIPGAAQNFDSGTGLTGSGLAGYCRAAGPVFDYFSGANSIVRFDHNTVVTYQPTIFEPGCYHQGQCGSSPLNFTNNIVLGITSTYNFSPFNPGQKPGLFYKDDGSVPIQASHNIWYGIKNDYSTCNTNGTLCIDPLLANEPGQQSVAPESTLDNFNFHPSAGSPANSAGLRDALTPLLDYYGNPQTILPTIGAAVR